MFTVLTAAMSPFSPQRPKVLTFKPPFSATETYINKSAQLFSSLISRG